MAIAGPETSLAKRSETTPPVLDKGGDANNPVMKRQLCSVDEKIVSGLVGCLRQVSGKPSLHSHDDASNGRGEGRTEAHQDPQGPADEVYRTSTELF